MVVQAERDNSTVPFIRSGDSFTRDSEIIKQDAGRSAVLAPYTVMGRDQVTIPTTGTADGGNTGDGTMTVVSAGIGGPPGEGSWEVECVAAVGNGGVFKLTDPAGNIIANDLTMTPGAGAATVFIVGGLIFTLTDGATDFAQGDLFTLAVTADGDIVPFIPGAVNGAQNIAGIYLGDEVTAAAIVAGDIPDNPLLVGAACTVDSAQIVFDDGATTLSTVLPSGKTVREELSVIGIFAEDTVDIDSFET